MEKRKKIGAACQGEIAGPLGRCALARERAL